MKLYSNNDNYKLYQGNMLDMLEAIEPNSIDSVVTDPPYGLTSITKRFGKENSAECQYGKDGSFARLSRGFMGKEWDGSGIEYNIDTWKKCYEALKPGGYLLAFGGSRTFHRIACAIEDAGFEIRDTIMWLYGSGFPKSMDISKQIDKKGGNDYSKQFAKDLKQARESRNLTMKYCDDKYCNGSTNWSWYEGRKDGCRVPDYQTYLKIIKEFPELEKYRELIKEAEREVIGKKEYTNDKNVMNISNYNGERVHLDITIPSTDLAKQWQGWGTALKPSFEPIIVARKPFKGSLVDNVIEYGVGGINIDECRVPFNGDKWKNQKSGNTAKAFNLNEQQREAGTGVLAGYECEANENGRFPANTILTYDETPSDERLRYFYCAKANKKDRDEGLEEFEEKKGIRTNAPRENEDIKTQPRKNTHPTVKPTELMQYLVRLVTPNGGTILDPFNGSGSTGKAVMYENKERNKNYKYIGIELTEEYLPIAKARIEYVCNLTQEELKEQQMTIFDILESKGQ